MKKIILHIILLSALSVLMSNCSTKKNTWATRTYKAINTRFNVYFNGITSFEDGMNSIIKSNVDDFSDVIPMYPISKPANAKTATSSMDKTIEKCRKAIKVYSIKQKPQQNSKKLNNPEYKNFINQKEFNPVLKDAWLLLAKAEFHKGDFLGSVGTFAYISRFYSTDKDMVTKCKLWTARAYTEMDWIYEAEQVLSKINQSDINSSNTSLYTSVNANLLLKKRMYKEAIPFLEMTLSKEKDKYYKERFNYILAQLYQKTGNNKAAFETYQKVLKFSPPYEMEFNARINCIELNSGNINNIRKDIKRMIRNPNNKDYLDQLYYVMGKTYLQKADTTKAIENFIISGEKSTRNGLDKALTLITLGDLYYIKKDYVKAQPCYDEASKLITVEHPEYNRISALAQSLGELVVQYEIVTLQDSLQRLSAMPENKRLEIVKKIIEKVIADEKAASEKKENETQGENFGGIEPDFSEPMVSQNRIGSNNSEWYFYNSNLMKTGQQDFQKKWGKRKLEDNWRRINKSAVMFADEKEKPPIKTAEALADSTATDTTVTKLTESDNKNPEFYLQQIPVTPSQIKKSNAEIATALYNMGFIYKDKIEDLPISVKTFDEFRQRFPDDERVHETLYQVFLIYTKLGNNTLAEKYRLQLLKDFPESKYAILLSSPDYIARQKEMLLVQDSIYNLTYQAFNASNFNVVKKNTSYFQEKYSHSPLLPKFLFLNALSIGKTENSEIFEASLSKLVEDYPQSDVSAMSKDILALLKQGKEAKTGTSQGTLLALRDEVNKTDNQEVTNKTFTPEKQTKHRLLLITSGDDTFINKLLYNVASFNFSRFMVKDFDLSVNKLDSLTKVLSVTNFESYDEADWYYNSLEKDSALSNLVNNYDIQEVIISEDNFGLLKTMYTLSDYLNFKIKNLDVISETALAQNPDQKPTKKPEKVKVTNQNNNKLTTASSETKNSTDNEKLDKEYAEKLLNTIPEKSSVPLIEKTGSTTYQNPNTIQNVQKKAEQEAPIYKNLFTYRPDEQHFVAITILSGNINFDKTKTSFDSYNANNYGIMNLKVSLETYGKMQIIIIGSFADANVAKSYLIRMVKEKSLFDNMNDASYRNLVGSQKNLNIMMQENAIKTYIEFMQLYYLK